MTISEQNNKGISSRFAWPFALLLVALFMTTEALPFIFGTGYDVKWDWSFTYVTMHFVLLPTACIAHVGLNLFRIVRFGKNKLQLKLKQFSSVIVSVGYLIFLLYFHTL